MWATVSGGAQGKPYTELKTALDTYKTDITVCGEDSVVKHFPHQIPFYLGPKKCVHAR
jgi:hypothetical protein